MSETNQTAGEEPDYSSGRNYGGQTQAQILTAQLPSQRAHHSIAGTTLTRRKMAERKKSAKKRVGSGNEVINMEPILGSQQELPEASAGAKTVPVVQSQTDALLGELTYKDMDTLKELTCPMAQKRDIRKLLIEEQGQQRTNRFYQTENVRLKQFRQNWNEVIRQSTLWRSSIHEIEGRFGNGVRSYFSFLRWLFILNLYIFTLIFVFITVPMIIFDSVGASSNSTVPTECQYNPYDPNTVSEFQQYIIWWFTGQGFMENTLLFYGYYESEHVSIANFNYEIQLAYICVAFFYFLLSLILIVRRAATGLKESLVGDEDRFYTYCNKVFAGWDFCITDDRAATLKHSSLKYELQTDLEEERIRERQRNRTTKQKAVLYAKRFFINCLVICILVASLVGIYFAADFALKNSSTYDQEFFVDLIVTYLVSIVITVANFIAPVLFEILIRFEDYSPGFTIKFTLIRTVFLRLASVVFLYVVVYLQINCERYNFGIDPYLQCNFCEGMQCWETYLGQEMYKLTILDFFIVIAVTLFVEFPRKLIVEHCQCGLAKWWGHQEFSIPENVLDIVYAQTIGWIGAFYAPLLPVMVVLKFFIFFYLKKLTLLYNCRPATRPYRASRSGTFFFIILLVGFTVAALPVAVGIAIIQPSQDCGPFRGLTTMFSSITAAILNFPDWLRDIFWFIGSAGFSVIVGVILCLVLYYYVALSSAHKKMIFLLKDQLALEGKDKQFLLNRVNKLSAKLQNSDAWVEQKPFKQAVEPSSGRDSGVDNQGYVRGSTASSLPGQTDRESNHGASIHGESDGQQ
uniref:Transmembrane channel-like protein 7 n=1 Tax=Phallusia mammillata TaxID=59560 RepID=A0A6F9DUA9_9ASCI|nr:transmembrane channel-like protein 7 [Phallusia mammillata]